MLYSSTLNVHLVCCFSVSQNSYMPLALKKIYSNLVQWVRRLSSNLFVQGSEKEVSLFPAGCGQGTCEPSCFFHLFCNHEVSQTQDKNLSYEYTIKKKSWIIENIDEILNQTTLKPILFLESSNVIYYFKKLVNLVRVEWYNLKNPN